MKRKLLTMGLTAALLVALLVVSLPSLALIQVEAARRKEEQPALFEF